MALAEPRRIRARVSTSEWHARQRRAREYPDRLVDRLREANRGRDVHLVGEPRTIETFRALGALDKLGLILLPLLVGDGMRLTPWVSTDAGLVLESERELGGGALEIVYACKAWIDEPARAVRSLPPEPSDDGA